MEDTATAPPHWSPADRLAAQLAQVSTRLGALFEGHPDLGDLPAIRLEINDIHGVATLLAEDRRHELQSLADVEAAVA